MYSKSSQKCGIHDTRRSCTRTSAAPFSSTQYCSAMCQSCTIRIWWSVPIRESYFGFLNDVPVTVEEFIDGQFAKYINNDGRCKTLPPGDMKCVYQKVQSLVHYSYELSLRGNLCSLTYREACTIYTTQKSLLLSYLMEKVRFIFVREISPSMQFRTLWKNTCVVDIACVGARNFNFFKWKRKCKFRWRQWQTNC